MAVSTTCPSCHALFRLADELAGKTVQCQKCTGMFIVPSGDGGGTQAGIPLTVDEPLAPEPAAALALPPELPPPIPSAADESEQVQDGPSQAPPPEKSEPRRPSKRERAPAKAGSSMMPFVFALLGLGLFLCLGCGGVGAIWYIARTERPMKAAKVVEKKGVVKFDVPKDFDKDAFPKDALVRDGFKRVWNPQPPPLPPPAFPGFKDGKLPAPPPPGPPGSVSVVFGPDGVFTHNDELTLMAPRKWMDTFLPGIGNKMENKRHKLYVARLEAGQTYRIDMISMTERLDCYLFLRDAAGNKITEDDDGGGFPHALIRYKPVEAGIFHIEATYFLNPGDIEPTGNFRLVVWHDK